MRRMFSEKQLNKQYVKIIPAPESTTLTDDQIAQFTSGVHVEGSFLGFTNPFFNAPIFVGSTYYGQFTAGQYIGAYQINSSKTISTISKTTKSITLRSISEINGKTLPNDPANTGTFTLKCVDGSLAWVEDD